jgi:Na+/H+-dicarboxylate symporter
MAILFAVIGLLLGAMIGLLVGNSIAPGTSSATAPASQSAPSLTQDQLNGGQLPAGHPQINGSSTTATATK